MHANPWHFQRAWPMPSNRAALTAGVPSPGERTMEQSGARHRAPRLGRACFPRGPKKGLINPRDKIDPSGFVELCIFDPAPACQAQGAARGMPLFSLSCQRPPAWTNICTNWLMSRHSPHRCAMQVPAVTARPVAGRAMAAGRCNCAGAPTPLYKQYMVYVAA